MNTLHFRAALAASTALFVVSIITMAQPELALAAGPATIDLSSANGFAIISETGITNTGSHTTSITGDIGSSPITSAAMDGIFCSEMTGTIFGVDAAYTGSGSQTCYAGNPPLSNKTLIDNAVLDMQSAYSDAAGRTIPDGTDLYAGNIGGQTFAPGLYTWSTDVSIPADVTLSGGANDVWIFQVAGNLDVASGGSVPAGVHVNLIGGAQASNIFWQVGGVTGATLGTYSTFNGTILTAKQVIVQTGAVLNGRAFAQTQVTLDSNVINKPVFVVPPPVAASVEPVTNVSHASSLTPSAQSSQLAQPIPPSVTSTTTVTTTQALQTPQLPIMIDITPMPTFPHAGFAPYNTMILSWLTSFDAFASFLAASF